MNPIDDRIDSSSMIDLSPSSASTYSLTKGPLSFDVLEKKDGKLKIHMLSLCLESIKNIGLSEDFANFLIDDSDLLIIKKDDHLGKCNVDLLGYLRNPPNDCSCDNLYDTPPLFDEDKVNYLIHVMI